jgi:peptide deformylase
LQKGLNHSLKAIRLYTDPILSKPCELVRDFTGLEPLILEMFEIMEANNAVGLAANQIGINKQICVMHLENKTKKVLAINPRIIRYTKEKNKQLEGCLSCPGAAVVVKRYTGVDVELQNILGEKLQLRFTNFDARVVQHEINHLNGRLISDPLKKYTKLL